MRDACSSCAPSVYRPWSIVRRRSSVVDRQPALPAPRPQPIRQIRHAHVQAGQIEQRLGRLVRFGVDGRVVQRVAAAGDAQEAGRLLERFRPQPLDFLELGSRAERAVGVPVLDNRRRQPLADARHIAQQCGRGGVHVDADVVDDRLDHRIQRGRQLLLIDVVLIQPDPDRLRIDLDQLGQRVLQAAGDGDRPAHRDVQIGELGARDVGRGVDRRARLADHDVGELGRFLDQFSRQRLGLPAGGAVADGDHADLVGRDQRREGLQRLLALVARLVRVDRDRVQQLAGGIDGRHLAAGAEAGVDAHHGPLAQGRLEEQVAQIGGENLDGVIVAELAQLAADLALDRGAQEPLVAVLHRQAYVLGGRRGRRLDPARRDAGHDGAVGCFHPHLQAAVLAAALERQPLMRLDGAQRAAKVVVDAIPAFRVGFIAGALADRRSRRQRNAGAPNCVWQHHRSPARR